MPCSTESRLQIQLQITEKTDKSFRKRTSGEYLSGFYKEDVLKPVVTLVIHFGADEWDAPLSLHEMMGSQNEKSDALCPGLPDPSDRPGETDGRGSEQVYIESAGSDRVY